MERKFFERKQPAALEKIQSDCCDLVECTCGDDPKQCLCPFYLCLFGKVEPNCLAIGIFALYQKEFNLAELESCELKSCDEWSDLQGKFAANSVTCSTIAEELRRVLQGLSPVPPARNQVSSTAAFRAGSRDAYTACLFADANTGRCKINFIQCMLGHVGRVAANKVFHPTPTPIPLPR